MTENTFTLPSFGPAMLNHLWQSTVFVAAVWLVTLLLRRNPASTRSSLWLTASAKFLVPFSLLIGLGSLFPRPSRVGAYAPQVVYSTADAIGQPFSDLPVLSHTPTHAASFTEQFVTALPVTLTAIWLCGAAIVLLVWTVRWRRVAAALREAVPMEDGREVEILRRLNRHTEISVRASQELLEPGIFGILRPVLVWPKLLTERLEDEHIEAILTHELMHVQRRDNLIALLHMAVEAVFWFHPIVWWMERRMIEERELACDEAVVQMGGRPEIYAESLLKTCRFCLESPLPCIAGITGADLKVRIRSIMTLRLQKLNWSRKLLLAALGLAVVGGPVAFGVMHVVPLNAIESERSEMLASAQATSAKSIEFDVASIKENRSGSRDMSWGCKGTDGKTLSEVKDHSLNLAGYGDIPLGSCVVRNTPMQWIVGLAYQVPWDKVNQLIKGGPSWLSSGLDSPLRFDIDARAEQPATRAQLFLMLQMLLADRFQLKIHEDYKELPVFELTVAKNGPRLTKAPADRDCSVVVEPEVPCHNFSGGFGQGLTGRSVSMSDLADRLSRYTGRTVVDKTGLDGLYDIKTRDFWMPFPDVPDPGKPTIFEMLDQFGIKLKAAKAPVKVLVVDSAQEPSPN